MYNLFFSNYANELLGSYVTCILTMYYYLLLCNIICLTCLKPLHRFASILLIPTKIVKIGVPPLFLVAIISIIGIYLANS